MPAKPLDRFLAGWRYRVATPHIPAGARLLDIGCAEGGLFTHLGGHIRLGVGIDPDAPEGVRVGAARLIRGRFPADLPASERGESFDAITALAVFEHIATADQSAFAAACRELLGPGGRLLLTIPARLVDPIVDLLIATRLVEGMRVHEHHGIVPEETPAIFGAAGFRLVLWQRFELGLNHLFVFERQEEMSEHATPMLTVPHAARGAGQNAEAVRRWIRSGKLRARKVGTQYVIEERDLEAVLPRHRRCAVATRGRALGICDRSH